MKKTDVKEIKADPGAQDYARYWKKLGRTIRRRTVKKFDVDPSKSDYIKARKREV